LQPKEERRVDTGSTVRLAGELRSLGTVCRSPKRRQMEFTNKKNRDLREKVKQIVQISDAAALDDAAGLRTTAERVILLREIKQLALDVLVEL
jgi:hypothetical protein